MKLFKFGKKKQEVEEKSSITNDVQEEVLGKFEILCINLEVLDYNFTLSANDSGKIVIRKNGSEKEYNNITKSAEIFELITSNMKYFEQLSIDQKPGDNFIQLDINNKKYIIFRDESNPDNLDFYDKFIHDIANIIGIKKTYENVELNLSFDYPNNFKRIVGPLSDYCLLGASKPLVVFKDYDNNIITFEYIYMKSSLIEKLVNSIINSGDYELIGEEDKENIKTVIVDYKEKETIESFSFIYINDMCIIFTMPVGKKNDLNLQDIMNNGRIKDIRNILKSFKSLENEINYFNE